MKIGILDEVKEVTNVPLVPLIPLIPIIMTEEHALVLKTSDSKC